MYEATQDMVDSNPDISARSIVLKSYTAMTASQEIIGKGLDDLEH